MYTLRWVFTSNVHFVLFSKKQEFDWIEFAQANDCIHILKEMDQSDA